MKDSRSTFLTVSTLILMAIPAYSQATTQMSGQMSLIRSTNETARQRGSVAAVRPEAIVTRDAVPTLPAALPAAASSMSAAPGWRIIGCEATENRQATIEPVRPTMNFAAAGAGENVSFVLRLPVRNESQNVQVTVSDMRRNHQPEDRFLMINPGQETGAVSFAIHQPGEYEVIAVDQSNGIISARASFVVTAEPEPAIGGQLSFITGAGVSEAAQGEEQMFAAGTAVQFQFQPARRMQTESLSFMVYRITPGGEGEKLIDEVTYPVRGSVSHLVAEQGFTFHDAGQYRVYAVSVNNVREMSRTILAHADVWIR